MKIINLSDCHLLATAPVCRTDNIIDIQFDKLHFVFDYAVMNGIKVILQAGDLVDTKRSWDLLPRLISLLKFYRDRKGVELYMVKGQHDSYYHNMVNDKTIVGVLAGVELVHLLDSAPYSRREDGWEINIYGASYGEAVPEVTTKESNILVIHKQILMHKVFNKQEEYDYAPDFLHDHPEFDFILCGDAHQKFYFKEGKRQIVNTGCMLRLEASEACMVHHPQFCVYDIVTRKVEWVEIPHADALDVISDAHLVAKKEKEKSFSEFVAKVKETSGHKSMSFSRNMTLFLKRNNVDAGVKKIISEYIAEV